MLIKNMGLLISWLIINIKIDHPLITKNTINRKYQKICFGYLGYE